jgi:hypothetical protein
MDQIALVGPDVSAGKRLVEALESNLQVEAAFWWMDDDTWKLYLVTPLVHDQGPRFVFSRVLDVIESTADLDPDLFDRIAVFSPSAGVVTMLSLGGEEHIPKGRLVLNESVNSVYVAGAYFYKFQPKTFAKAS